MQDEAAGGGASGELTGIARRNANLRPRTTIYTPAIAAEILRRLTEGETLSRICADEHMPGRSTVKDWVLQLIESVPDSFSADYARARACQADHYADDVVDLADGTAVVADRLATAAADRGAEGLDLDVYRRVYNEEIQARRIRIDSRKWACGKIDPARYGDRTVLVGDEAAPIAHKHDVDLKGVPSDTLRAVLAVNRDLKK